MENAEYDDDEKADNAFADRLETFLAKNTIKEETLPPSSPSSPSSPSPSSSPSSPPSPPSSSTSPSSSTPSSSPLTLKQRLTAGPATNIDYINATLKAKRERRVRNMGGTRRRRRNNKKSKRKSKNNRKKTNRRR
jgi:hypothetical protein